MSLAGDEDSSVGEQSAAADAPLTTASNEQAHKTEVIIYVCLVILFPPFIKMALGRVVRDIVDVIVGIGLVASIFIEPKRL